MKIKLNQKEVKYTLRVSKKARHMRLAIYRDGNFVVTVPRNMNSNAIERFIIRKSQWIINKLEYFKSFSGQVLVKNSKKAYLEHKGLALALAQERIAYFNQMYGFKFHKISIKNQKTRWGSCSKKGNLNFNYKIASLPREMADYIIVHELCHLKEFNHSSNFWDLVAKSMPNYLNLRKQLKSGL